MHTDLNTNTLHLISEKFWNGETTLDEERELKAFFVSNPCPPGFEDLASYFASLEVASSESLDDSFDESVRAAMTGRKSSPPNQWLLWSAAAAIIVLGLLFFRPESPKQNAELPTSPPQKSTLADASPEVRQAYEQTREALLILSSKFNKGQKQTLVLGKFSEAEQRVKTTTVQ